MHTARANRFVRPLDVRYLSGRGLLFSAPGTIPADVELFALTGRLLLRRQLIGIGSVPVAGRAGFIGSGLYIARVRQAKKLVQKCVRIVR